MRAAGLLSAHVLAGVLVELPLADGGAEVNRLSLVLALAGSRLLVDRHAAHRILDHVLPLSGSSAAAGSSPPPPGSQLIAASCFRHLQQVFEERDPPAHDR